MIKCDDFFKICKKYDLTFFSGVPDSTFKSWMTFLEKNPDKLTNIPTVNECEATAICTGHFLATGQIGVLYMQNSGFGKTVNPITSLCDPKVYSIPMLLLIGWRGEPGVKDAFQHHKMGPITPGLLDLLEIPYEIISNDTDLDKSFAKAKEYMIKNSRPFAFVVKKGVFEKLIDEKDLESDLPFREDAIKIIMKHLKSDEIIVSTTGKTSREVFEQRQGNNQSPAHDFYNIGAMGCAQSIALGIAQAKKDKKVFVFDGDGSALMQLGSLATTGHVHPDNFYHIIFDNCAHDSTGGQPTCSESVDFGKIALGCNYKSVFYANNLEEIEGKFANLIKTNGPNMLIIKIKKGARDDLGRPPMHPRDHKKHFMEFLKEK